MAYIGQGIKQGTFKVLDTSGNTYNGSNTTFNLGTQVGSAAQLLVSHDGVIQKAGTDYTLATGGTQITFSTAPASGASIFITEISGAVGGTVTPSDASVTTDKLADSAVTTAKVADSAVTTAKVADTAVTSAKLNSAILTGQTDIGAGIADADLFLVDDGAGGTLRKTAASRIKTYVGGFDVTSITGATELTEEPATTDEFVISDNGTLKRIDYSLIKSGLLKVSGAEAGGQDVASVAFDAVFTDAYTNYMIVFQISQKNNNGTIGVRFRNSSGDNTSSNYLYSLQGADHDDSTGRITSSGGNSLILISGQTTEDDAVGSCRGSFIVHDPNTSSIKTHATFNTSFNDASGNLKSRLGGAILNTAEANTGFTFVGSSQNIENYKVKIYGIKR